MPDRTKKRPRDPNQLAKFIVGIATGDVAIVTSDRDTAATELARRGGLKGGKARADSLTPQRRREIALNAAKKRWGGKRGPDESGQGD